MQVIFISWNLNDTKIKEIKHQCRNDLNFLPLYQLRIPPLVGMDYERSSDNVTYPLIVTQKLV